MDQSQIWERFYAVLLGRVDGKLLRQGRKTGAWRRVVRSGCVQRGTLSLGRRQQGSRRVGDKNTSRGRGLRKRGLVRVTWAQAGKGKTERGRRKWEPKKEVRNCGGGSRPWKRRGKGEVRMECLHFREGRARASLDTGLCGRRLGKVPQADGGGGAVPGVPAPAALPEPLLSRRVPELQLDPLARLDLQQAGEEVHADSGVAGWGAQPGKAALSEAVQEARLAHCGVPDHDEAELVDPDGLHRSRAQLALGPPHPPTRCGASKAAGTVPSAPPGRSPAGFQHIPAASAAAWTPPSLEGEAGPGRARGGPSGQWAEQGPW